MNSFEYSKAQLQLKTGSRFIVPPELKAARNLHVARPAFIFRFAKNSYERKIQVAGEDHPALVRPMTRK